MTSERLTPSIGFCEPIGLVKGLLQKAPKWGLLAILVLIPLSAFSQSTLRQIGQLRLPIVGISAKLDQTNPVFPKNFAAGVTVSVTSGTSTLSAADVALYLGGAFQIQGDLTGPGLSQPLSLPQSTSTSNPLLLPIPGLTVAGNYQLSNLRFVVNGNSVLDISPGSITIQVIDQVLITSVQTTPLTLDQIKALGIVLDSNAYTGFQFTLGLLYQSQQISFSFPVVFDQNGVVVPQPIAPPGDPGIQTIKVPGLDSPGPSFYPVLLKATGELPTLPDGSPIRVPGLIVIPGNVGYLKQFFIADLYVANGAPVGSGLSVHGVTGTIQLPPGADGGVGTSDDPLALPNTVNGAQSTTLPVLAPDSSGQYTVDTLNPGDQGRAEWSIRGDKEGFYPINFSLTATLDGLVTGPVQLTGKASGAVLVRNPYFAMTFSVPSVVRVGQAFNLNVTVTNIGLAAANNLTVALDSGQLSGAHLTGPGHPGDRHARSAGLCHPDISVPSGPQWPGRRELPAS